MSGRRKPRRFVEEYVDKNRIVQLLDGGGDPRTMVFEAEYSYSRFDSSGRGTVAGLVGIGMLEFFDKAAKAAHDDSRNKSFGVARVALIPGPLYSVERVATTLAAVQGLTLKVFPGFLAEEHLQNVS